MPAPRLSPRLLGTLLVSAVTFGCYRATLLPGLDLGDTASFQAVVDSMTLTPRQAYPLYYAIGNLFVWTSAQEPAYAMNLASAVYGALASGLTAWVAAGLAGSAGAGIFGGLLIGFSYTFWSQAIIAEVYTLHLLMIAVSLAALLAWARRPTTVRLSIFFAVYALGFGNHMSMVLLLPGFALLVLFGGGQGPRAVLQPRIVALAAVIAALAALQYGWNFRGLWSLDPPPAGLRDALGQFWFDVTKADWRRSLVFGVDPAAVADRFGMYWFDLRQQFGVPGVVAAAAGTVHLLGTSPLVVLSITLLYAANLLFALTYNVGDTHVFLLPAHLAVALAASAGVTALQALVARATRARWAPALVAGICLLYPAWRAWDTWPAVDRSGDRRATEFLDAMTGDVTDQDALFGLDMNWQLENALDYYEKYRRPDLAWFRTDEVADHFPALVRDNAEIGRLVLATPLALDRLAAACGGQIEATPDPRVKVPGLADVVSQLPPGTPYALALLDPYTEFPVDHGDLAAAIMHLTGGRISLRSDRRYQVIVGTLGTAPALVRSEDRPYRTTARIGALQIDVRMESWLPADTMRRAGFGHLIVNRRHALTFERGISLTALDRSGRVSATTYRGGLFAPQPRYVVRTRG